MVNEKIENKGGNTGLEINRPINFLWRLILYKSYAKSYYQAFYGVPRYF